MTFNSMEFVVLLMLVVGLHWVVPPRWRNRVLLVGSYAFYGWWDWRLLGLLVLSTVVDHLIAHRLAATPSTAETRRRALLAVSVVTNLGVLAGFKYADFFISQLGEALGMLGLQANPALLNVVVPVGISFYTFQTLGFTIDNYRGRARPVDSLLDFATYVAYFPQLVAGPIERARRLMPQILDKDRRPPRGPRARAAASLIAVGLFKKVVIADGVAPMVNEVFAGVASQGAVGLLLSLLGFAVQIYADFSGYSSIARGVSLLFGIELSVNFAQPYLSRSVTEFWQRWHISLSTWLRDYLYIPLGGNRRGPVRTGFNLMATMLLGGLWHGAGWTFVVWGGIHGLLLVGERIAGKAVRRPDQVQLRELPAALATFTAVTLTWTFFRAAQLDDAVAVLQRIATWAPGPVDLLDTGVVGLAAATTLLLDLAQRRQTLVPDRPLVSGPVRVGLAAAGMLVGIVVFSGGVPEPFIYFQF